MSRKNCKISGKFSNLKPLFKNLNFLKTAIFEIFFSNLKTIFEFKQFLKKINFLSYFKFPLILLCFKFDNHLKNLTIFSKT